MTPHRTGGKRGGSFAFDRIFPAPVGRLRMSSGARTVTEFRRRDALLTKLHEMSQVDLLLALKERRVSIEALVAADRQDGVRTTLDRVRLAEPLWDAVEKLLPRLGRAPATRARYAASFRRLQTRGAKWLSATARVADLERVDWEHLAATWGASPADWNRMRTALSAFLSAFLGPNRRAGKYHPLRHAIMSGVPELQEPPPVVPDVTPESFVRIVRTAEREDLVAPFWVIVLTGFRIGEYLACDATHLLPHTHRVRNPTGKSGPRYVAVDPAHWRWIHAGIPCRLGVRPAEPVPVQFDSRYKRLRRIWRRLCARAGVPAPTFHELRHCHGQWASLAGKSDAQVGSQLGHGSPATTRRYTKTVHQAEVAAAVGAALSAAVSQAAAS